MTEPQPSPLADIYDPLAACNRCGYCAQVCPTYVVTGRETLTARGRNQLVRLAIEGKLENLEEAREAVDTCLLCRACTTVCFSQVPTADFMAKARVVLAKGSSRNRARSFLFRRVFTKPKLLRLLFKAAFLLKRVGLSGFLRKIGLLKLLSPKLHHADELLEHAPNRFLTERLKDEPQSGKTGYFASCGMEFLFPDAGMASFSLLKKEGMEPHPIPQVCCGLAPHSAGDEEASRALARKNLDFWEKSGSEPIVCDDSSCAVFLSEYPKLLPDDPRAKAVAQRVKDLTAFLAERGLPKRAVAPKTKVTYHDSCQALNGLGLKREPRETLSRVEGVELRELPEIPWCCGGAGTYCLEHTELSEEILERKLSHIKETGAEVVLTSAASCLLHIQYGLKKKGWPVKAVSLSQFLAGENNG